MKAPRWADPGQPGFLGLAHAPFKPNADGQAHMVAQRHHARPACRPPRRWSSSSTASAATPTPAARSDGLDAYHQQAFGILTSSKLAEALDLERGRPAAPRPLRPRLARAGRLRRRRAAAERLLPRRPAAGRGRRPRASPGLRPLGLARPAARHQLRERPRSPAAARPGPDARCSRTCSSAAWTRT